MPACCSWNDALQYETNKVTRIHSMNYGTIKWILHMFVLSYVSLVDPLAMLSWGRSHLQCQYQSVKFIHIQSVWLGTLRSIFIVVIFLYICFALVSDKLYQQKEPLISSVHTKVKGIAEVMEETVVNGEKKVAWKVLDTADYTFPLQGNSFFVMTNFLKTEGQVQGVCPEYPTPRTLCSTDRGCKKGWMDPQSKGIQTGRCVQYKGNQKTCEVSAWCPIEAVEEAPRPALLNSAENFTVLIKNNIDFPGHNYTTRNILPGFNISCTFHKTQNPQCPIFRLGDIFQETGENFTDVAIKGGIMGIEIYWDCNLDKWFHHCRPKYSFRRLDDKSTKESLYPGYNFRYAKYYKESNTEKRTLLKVFGIRFDILVFGTGGKFDIIQLVVYIGSTLSYFGLATFFIDFLINTFASGCCRAHVYPRCKCCEPCGVNEYYYKKKYETVVEPTKSLKYVSFVDEPYIRMVNQQLLGQSLQTFKGEEVPRPPMDFRDLFKLPLSLPESSPTLGQETEMQPLREATTPKPQDSPHWCQCGHCFPSELNSTSGCLEELCCRQKPGACITTSDLFRKLVLSRHALQFVLFYQEPLLEMELDPESTNSRLRHCAYQSYTTWRFGPQDIADYAILPSCCRWRIRKEFPKTKGQYSGFKHPY